MTGFVTIRKQVNHPAAACAARFRVTGRRPQPFPHFQFCPCSDKCLTNRGFNRGRDAHY